MKVRFFHIDVFAKSVFNGNPAIVCILPKWLDDDLLLKIAIEFNQKIIAFLVEESGYYYLRWFTVKQEVLACGHGTMAAAFVIQNYLSSNEGREQQIVFKTTKEDIVVDCDKFISIQLPIPKIHPASLSVSAKKLFGIEPKKVLQSHDRYCAVFENEQQLVDVSPDFQAIKHLALHSFVITSPSEQYDFVSRTFGPKVGINEDYVTGTSHALLALYWSNELNKKEFIAKQLSKRPSEIACRIEDNKVVISGECCLFSKGEIDIR